MKVTIRWICHVATLLMLMGPTEAHILSPISTFTDRPDITKAGFLSDNKIGI